MSNKFNRINQLPQFIKTIGAAGTALLFTAPVLAQGNLRIPTTDVAQFSITSIGSFIGAVMSPLFIIAGVLVFVFLVWGGLQWLTSGGDSAATQAARDRITSALVGLAIIALAWAIMQLVEYFFGISVANDGTDVLPQPFVP